MKEVISPELIKLNNDLVVRLIGIKENPESNGEATKFLKDKTNNQQIFLKFDEKKHDSSNNLLAYVYLKNKTFLNAHLIKNGFALVDTKMKFKNKTKFRTLEENYAKQ